MYADVLFDLGKGVSWRCWRSARGRRQGRSGTSTSPADDLKAVVREFKIHHPGEMRAPLPEGSQPSAVGGDRGGVQELAHAPGRGLSAGCTVSPTIWVRGHVVAMVYGKMGDDQGRGGLLARLQHG